MSKYIALLIDTLNHDFSISEFLDPTDRIHKILEKYGQTTWYDIIQRFKRASEDALLLLIGSQNQG